MNPTAALQPAQRSVDALSYAADSSSQLGLGQTEVRLPAMIGVVDDVLRNAPRQVEEHEIGDHSAHPADRLRLLTKQLLSEVGASS